MNLQVVRVSEWCLLTVSGPGATNFVLQTSPDLVTWANIYHAYGNPGTNAFYSFDSRENQKTFWRALPGEDLTLRQQRWRDNGPTHYTFQFRRMISFWEGGVRGKVRVLNGTIVEVTNAVDDRSGLPIQNPDYGQFFSIDQILWEMRRAYADQYEFIKVVYDSSELYPTKILLDWRFSVADDESTIEATNLTVLEP